MATPSVQYQPKEAKNSHFPRETEEKHSYPNFSAHFTRAGYFCKGKNTTECIFRYLAHNM
jgi:hypothetical protein